MRAYIELTKKSFAQSLAYRTEVWLRIIGNIIMILIQVSIWKALLTFSTKEDLTLTEMITYSIITTLLTNITMLKVFQKVDENLKTGNITVHLLKPLRYSLNLFFAELGTILYQLVFVVFPTTLCSTIFFGMEFPPIDRFIPFLISIFIATSMSFFLGYLVGLIAFWFMTTFALNWIITALISVFSGSFLPLWFFPNKWYTIAQFLPFQYLSFIPTSIYLGKMDNNEIYITLAKGIGWIIIIFISTSLLWTKSIRRLEIQGG